MAKPFSIQSPEDIAKEYAGNKQRIAQAMQMGIVDPTAGVLAGMFIDRMRAGQMQEGMPQATVAQQVMGGAPPVPAPPPVPAAGGLGATPQAAPPMAPEMAPPMPQGAPMAPPMPQEAPMGMAEGGLAMLPVPDAMFDEPSNGGFNDGYAGGGIVAFAAGGTGISDLYEDVERVESGSDQSAVSPKGARGVMQLMPGTMRDPGFGVRPMQVDTEAENRRVGREYLDAMYRRYGDKATALMAYNWGPGNVDKWIRSGRPANKVPAETRNYLSKVLGGETQAKGSTAAAPAPSVESLQAAFPGALKAGEEYYAANMPKRKNEGLDLLTAQAREALDPENQKRQRDQDKWMTLAEVGFNMAASNSPFLLQAAGAAAAAALPGARAAKKERESIKREAIRDLAAAEDITYKQAAEKTKFVMDFAGSQLGLKKDDLARVQQMDIEELQQRGATERTRMTIQGDLDAAAANAAADATGNKGPTTAQASSLMPGYKSRYEDALKRMQAAETAGDYSAFKAARSELNNAFGGYNTLARQLGLPPLVSNKLGDYPKMSKIIETERAQGGTGGKKSSAMEEADRIIAG